MLSVRTSVMSISRFGSLFRRAASSAAPSGNGGIYSDTEQATGIEKEELEARLKGKPLFETEIVGQAFGTKENPVVIKSAYDSRIIGCLGTCGDSAGDHSHEFDYPLWHTVKKGEDHTCPVCEQVFRLGPLVGDPSIAELAYPKKN